MGRLATLRSASADHRLALLAKIERATEVPLMILSAAMIPLIARIFVWESGPISDSTAITLYGAIWAIFVLELAVRIVIAPQRARYLEQNWIDVAAALIPVARPLRIPLILLLGSHAYGRRIRFAHVDFLAGYAVGLVLLIATIVTSVEQGRDSPIESFGDALWWSVATVTTVGYGDVVPITTAGRASAYVLMLGGIGLFAALTANLASLLTRREGPEQTDTTALSREVRELRETLERLQGRDPQP